MLALRRRAMRVFFSLGLALVRGRGREGSRARVATRARVVIRPRRPRSDRAMVDLLARGGGKTLASLPRARASRPARSVEPPHRRPILERTRFDFSPPPPVSHLVPSSLFSSRTGTYIDKKCPFTGNVSIRGRILTGTVKSYKMKRTLIMRMDYLHYIQKYQRYEKRHTNIAAHISPCFRCFEGDTVVVGQCRPLSKTVRFNTLKVIPSGSKAGKSFAAH